MTVPTLQNAQVDRMPANMAHRRIVLEIEPEVGEQVVVHDVTVPEENEDDENDSDDISLTAPLFPFIS